MKVLLIILICVSMASADCGTMTYDRRTGVSMPTHEYEADERIFIKELPVGTGKKNLLIMDSSHNTMDLYELWDKLDRIESMLEYIMKQETTKGHYIHNGYVRSSTKTWYEDWKCGKNGYLKQ